MVVIIYQQITGHKYTKETMDAVRQKKAEAIVYGGRITREADHYLVPSQSGPGRYKVICGGLFDHCNCEDFELTGRECKHLMAVKLWLERTRPANHVTRDGVQRASDR
jgi:SWIM zinc finger